MTEHLQHKNGHGWRSAAIGAFGGLSMLFAGWMLNEAATERRSMYAAMNDDRKGISENLRRIAVLEAQVRRLTYDLEQL